MSDELATPLRRWLLSSRTRRQVAKALGGGDYPNDAYLRMATTVCQFLWSDAVNQPHTDPTWSGRSSDPEPAPDLRAALERLRETHRPCDCDMATGAGLRRGRVPMPHCLCMTGKQYGEPLRYPTCDVLTLVAALAGAVPALQATPTPLDDDEQAAILDDAVGPADFGEVARSEVMYSAIRALKEQGYEIAARRLP